MKARPTARPGSASLQTLSTGLLTVVWLMCWSSLPASDLTQLDLGEILDRTRVTPPARVAFREERHNPMLQEPLLLSGYLEYLEDGVLRKVIESPARQTFLIQGDHVTIERDSGTRKLSLRKSRALRTILGAIEAILAGQPERLESDFSYELSGTSDAWSVRLTPTSSRISKQLTSLHVDGDSASATSIRFNLEDGEWHRIIIMRTEPEQ